jgi:hypothetical protein
MMTNLLKSDMEKEREYGSLNCKSVLSHETCESSERQYGLNANVV